VRGPTGGIREMYLYLVGLVCGYGERGDVDRGASHGVAIEGWVEEHCRYWVFSGKPTMHVLVPCN